MKIMVTVILIILCRFSIHGNSFFNSYKINKDSFIISIDIKNIVAENQLDSFNRIFLEAITAGIGGPPIPIYEDPKLTRTSDGLNFPFREEIKAIDDSLLKLDYSVDSIMSYSTHDSIYLIHNLSKFGHSIDSLFSSPEVFIIKCTDNSYHLFSFGFTYKKNNKICHLFYLDYSQIYIIFGETKYLEITNYIYNLIYKQ